MKRFGTRKERAGVLYKIVLFSRRAQRWGFSLHVISGHMTFMVHLRRVCDLQKDRD
jgi:hypothetical protein